MVFQVFDVLSLWFSSGLVFQLMIWILSKSMCCWTLTKNVEFSFFFNLNDKIAIFCYNICTIVILIAIWSCYFFCKFFLRETIEAERYWIVFLIKYRVFTASWKFFNDCCLIIIKYTTFCSNWNDRSMKRFVFIKFYFQKIVFAGNCFRFSKNTFAKNTLCYEIYLKNRIFLSLALSVEVM